MTDIVRDNVCWHDPRSTYYVGDDDGRQPRSDCACDCCFYGRDKLAVEIDRLNAELAECKRDAKRLDRIEAMFFERKWDGTIGRVCDWYLVGNYRHVAQRMKGDTLVAAIDAARKVGA